MPLPTAIIRIGHKTGIINKFTFLFKDKGYHINTAKYCLPMTSLVLHTPLWVKMYKSFDTDKDSRPTIYSMIECGFIYGKKIVYEEDIVRLKSAFLSMFKFSGTPEVFSFRRYDDNRIIIVTTRVDDIYEDTDEGEELITLYMHKDLVYFDRYQYDLAIIENRISQTALQMETDLFENNKLSGLIKAIEEKKEEKEKKDTEVFQARSTLAEIRNSLRRDSDEVDP